MEIISTTHSIIPGGFRLSTTLDGEPVTVFAVVSTPDLEAITQIVPAALFDRGSQVHANVVSAQDDVVDKLLEVVENMNPEDVAVFLCEDEDVVHAVMDALAVAQD